MKINDIFLKKVLNKLIEHKATPILVGGCVRDSFLNIAVKDYDVEVYGLNTLEELEEILKEFGSVNLVGKSFGIVKLSTKTMEYDFSFPRLENKIADWHTGFDVVINGHLNFKEASKRRDFTINSIGYDYKNKIYLDPFYGLKDIEERILRHIDDDTFTEDPLRVYRAIQFIARFDFVLDIQTFKLCKQIVQTDEFLSLSKERIYEEYKKLFLKSKQPSKGLKLLNAFKIEHINKQYLQYIDEIKDENLNQKDTLILIFFILDDLFIKISDDKKLYKQIVSLKNFTVPRIFEKRLIGIDSFIKQLIIKFQMLNNMPKPLFIGKDLIKMGYKPSEKFKTILDTLYKMQLNGAVCQK
jgi:tRNA nucleotidyltransferase (CCA-adding enzyme)